MKNAFLIAKNIFKIRFRKKGSIFAYIILPVAVIALSLFMQGNSSGTLKIGVYNENKTSILAKDLQKVISSNKKFKLIKVKEEEINTKVSESKVDCVVVIPKNYEKDIYSGTLNNINIISIKGEDTIAWIQNFINNYIGNLMDISKASKGDKKIFNRIYKGYKEAKFKIDIRNVKDVSSSKRATLQSVGLLLMIILGGTGTIANVILTEKKKKTYYRIKSTPTSGQSYILGNVLANLFIVFMESILIIVCTRIFKIETYVPDMIMFVILMTFGLAAIGLGILIVSFSSSGYQANTLSTLIITPSCMISGCFWPIDMMPGFMKKIAYFMPQRWALQSIEKIQNQLGFKNIVLDLIIILGFALVFFLVGVYNFKNNKSIKI